MKHAPLLLLVAGFCRTLVLGATLADALMLCALTGAHLYTSFLESKKEVPINEAIKLELAALKNQVNALKMSDTFGKQRHGR